MKSYEGMFLFDHNAAHEWPAMEQEVRRLCERVGATLHVCLKFDERKLAYEIRGRKRGTYVLAYFDAPPEKLTDMERDAGLSEVLLRSLFLRIEPLSETRLAELRAHPAEQPLKPMAHDSRRDDRGGDRYGERPYGRRDYRDRPDRDRPDREGEGEPVGADAQGGEDRGEM